MGFAEGLRGDALIAGFKEALAGRPERLYVQLGIQSGLPGTRMNMLLAHAFATECLAAGKAADKLALEMALMSPEAAPGASPREFLPVCGTLALGARAAHEKNDPKLRKRVIAILHEASEDMRFRVREIVPVALAKIGAQVGDPLVHELVGWMDGFFHASAALLAMMQPEFLAVINDEEAALARLDEAYALAKNAARATSRYPGRKALIDALSTVPKELAGRFGVPVFDHLVKWSNSEDPELRGSIESVLRSQKLLTRYAPEVKRVQAALAAALPPPRDPTLAVKGMRGRGKKKGKHSAR
jgi:hypothetical protein